MTQIEHYIFSAFIGLVAWYGFWGPLLLELTTAEEWKKAQESADKFLDKLL